MFNSQATAALLIAILTTFVEANSASAQAVQPPLPTPAEMAEARRWAAAAFEVGGDTRFFSFTYGGKSSADLFASWKPERSTKKLDAHRTQHSLIYRDPTSRLEVRCVGVEYSDFPVVEWTIYFKNTGDTDTPIVSAIKAMDVGIERGSQGNFVLHTLKGDNNTPDSYEPLEHVLAPGDTKNITAVGGRPTQAVWPYFNIEADGKGVIAAVGWPGQWSADFTRDSSPTLRCTAGQELTHFKLTPGEEVRTPLIALMFWRGDYLRSQNLWRRWMLAHNQPKMKPILASCSGGFFQGLKVSRDSEKQWIDKFTQERIALNWWWMDAGWYKCDDWIQTGTWAYDADRFPDGIKEVSDYAHSKNMKLILWFEPERVHAGSWLAEQRFHWVFGGKAGGLLNLGDPECRSWLTDHIDAFLKSQGIDLYRQDYNIDPLAFWRNSDAPDRQGIAEDLYVAGYLAYWDELLKRNPGLKIDSCASGGRRNDLETLRRASPLLRSDYQAFDGNMTYALGNQGHTYGLSLWIPFYGQGVYWTPAGYRYTSRSHLSPCFALAADVRQPNVKWEEIRKAASDWQAVAPSMLSDYYPLTPYNLDNASWIAWQFNRPEAGDGMVQAFRRDRCEVESRRLRLHGLDADAQYEVTDLDANKPEVISGRDLAEQGLLVNIPSQPGAVLIVYKKVR